MIFEIAVLAISLSIDALGIGMSYRLKGVKITFGAKMAVGMIAAMVAFMAVFLGNQVMKYFPEDIVQILGTALLCVIGIAFIHKGISEKGDIFCDVDDSSVIEIWEAVLLGMGLSMDSLGTGIAIAGLEIHSFLFPVVVGIAQPLFLTLGERVGEKCLGFVEKKQKYYAVVSGFLLIFVAILQSLR